MVLLTIFFLIGFGALAEADQCGAIDTINQNRTIERINERYDDFFRYQKHLEEREEQMDKGRGENKIILAEREKKLETARLDFIRNRRPRPDTSALERQWEIDQKKRAEALEGARVCTIQQRAMAEKIERRGLKIPEMKEFGLDE